MITNNFKRNMITTMNTLYVKQQNKIDELSKDIDIKEQQPNTYFSKTQIDDGVLYSFDAQTFNKDKTIKTIIFDLSLSFIYTTIFAVIVFYVLKAMQFYPNEFVLYFIPALAFIFPLIKIIELITNKKGRLYLNRRSDEVVFKNDSFFSNKNLTLNNHHIDEYKVVEDNGFYYVSAVIYDDKKLLNIDGKYGVAKLTKQNDRNNQISIYLLKDQADALKIEIDKHFLKRNYYQSLKTMDIWK